MVDLKTLRQLIRLMVENDLTELDLEESGEKIKLRRAGGEVTQVVGPAPITTAAAANNPSAGSAAAERDAQNAVTINSPMVGTYYSAPSPDAADFVKVGQAVDEDTVVCIVEAMKVLNEIKAETRGSIERVLVENGQAVEFDHPLFVVKPA